MIDLLLVAGDSNSYGAETINDRDCDHPECPNHAYGFYLSKLLGCEYVNVSKSGASNTDITFQIFNFFKNNQIVNKKVLVVIGWTETTRTRLKGSLYVSNSIFTMYKELVKSKFNLEQFLLTNAHIQTLSTIDPSCKITDFLNTYLFGSDDTHRKDMINWLAVENFLKYNQISYFTFPTVYSYVSKSYFEIIDMLDKKNNVFNFNISKTKQNFFKNVFKSCDMPESIYVLEPRGRATLIRYGIEQKFDFLNKFKKFGIAKSHHLKEEAHKKVAEWIQGEIISRGIIES